MGPSRTARLYFLLVLDLIFFLLEITIGQSRFTNLPFSKLMHLFHPGYAVGSLALVADSFHMLKYSLQSTPSSKSLISHTYSAM
jgi:zinc transporter 1